MMKSNRYEILEVAKNTLRIESEALKKLVDQLDESFVACVEEIVQSRGRVIVTGVGKSALIGQKISATLNSTGTPAFFMHAADAVHGDLGMIQQDDLVLCLSKSGNTSELKALLPFISNMGNTIIAMTGNLESELARYAKYTLSVYVDQEADPNDLAPTASSTAQIAMGDALAVALLKYKGFKPKDFAQFHPGGSLGKQLYTKAEDLAAMNEHPSVDKRAELNEVILEISSKRLGAAVVLDEEDAIFGIITDGDLRRMLEKGDISSNLKAEDICTKQPITIDGSELAVRALKMMRQNSISQLIVTRKGQYSGIIHIHDLIREGLI
jgi:arabinose-5-phosphate isomerase